MVSEREERRERGGQWFVIYMYIYTPYIHIYVHTRTSTHSFLHLHTHIHTHRDEDVYWKLRLLSYICKRRARLFSRTVTTPRSPSRLGNVGSPRSPSRLANSPRPSSAMSHALTHTREPEVVKMVVVVFKKSSGRLPLTLEEGSPTVECGTEFR